MTDYDIHDQERIAREIAHDAFLLFIDSTGTAHYWSAYDQLIIAVDQSADADTIEFAADKTLSEYAEAVRSERGLRTEPRISAGLTDDLSAAI